MNFESLVGRINLIQDALQAQAAHAVNLSLTARRLTFWSLCLQRTCWWDIPSIRLFSTAELQASDSQSVSIWLACLPNLTQPIFFEKNWRTTSAKSQAKTNPTDSILRMPSAILGDRPATALRGRHPQVYAGEYYRRAV